MKKIFGLSLLFLSVLLSGNFYANTVFAEAEVLDPAPAPITVSLKIRSGENIFFNNLVELLPAGTTEITGHTLDARSVLSTLNKADLDDTSWNISDLQYFESFGSFLLNCITSFVNTDSPKNDCYEWQYAVNGITPGKGMDKNILAGGENIYVYFSPQNRITLSADTITTIDSLVVTAEKYNFEDNTWTPAIGTMLGVTQPDPASPYNPPIEIMTSPTEAIGQITFTSIPAGLYDVGIRDNLGYYFPTKPLTVMPPPPPNSGGGGSSSAPEPKFSVEEALAYLKSVQSTDGSFGDSDMYTDWAAIAYGAGNISGSYKSSLLEYLSSNNSISSLITDNERRTMALMALGENPYSFHDKNYIDAIVKEFDGTQFGDTELINDDIFALIPLGKAGYDKDDNIITKTIDFIISKKESDGSWEGSVDVTAAVIQALVPFGSVDGISEALSDAETYLKNTQASDGGWGNVSSTSWAIQAENALNVSWTKNDKSGLDYLAKQQTNADNNGAVLSSSETPENAIWATSYAIPAGLGKTWNEIMESFSKPKNEENNLNNSNKNSNKKEEKEVETTILSPVIPPVNEVIPVVSNIPPVTKKVAVVLTEKIENSSDAGSKEIEEIKTPALTATVTNALPKKNKPANLPIFLSTASGLILLYGVFKFLSKRLKT